MPGLIRLSYSLLRGKEQAGGGRSDSRRIKVTDPSPHMWPGGQQGYTTLHYTTLHYTTLHYITLHYTTLHYTTGGELPGG